MADITGKVLRDRYQVERLLGRGGMADVYLAFDTQRQTYVAIKLIREDLADDADFVRRFSREAAALARLDHPHVVRFYATEQDGILSFIVMDYVSGSTLQRRLGQAGGPLPLAEITALLRQIGPALHYAHTMGFIHRDIKPGNIMLREDGTALLSDFGAARFAESTLATLTLGTPAYMSPEQILGRDLQPQSDIYSFGVVLYEMLAGRRPFSGDEVGLTGTGTLSRLREAHLHLDPPDLTQLNPAVTPQLAEVVSRALAKDVSERWPNVLSLVSAWNAALGAGRQVETDALAASTATVVTPLPTPFGSRSGFQPVTPAAQPFQSQPASAAQPFQPQPAPAAQPFQSQPPALMPTPAPVQAEPPKRSSRALWPITGAVLGLLILIVAVWQLVLPALAAPRTASQGPDAAATAAALEAAAVAATATAESAQLALAAQAQQSATAEAQSTAQAVAAANAAAAQATQQASDAAAAAAAAASATEQAAGAAQATAAAAAVATEQAGYAAATATVQAEYAAATATAQAAYPEATATPQPTSPPPPTATPAAPAPTRTPAPSLPLKAPGVVLDFESDVTWRRGDQPYGELARVTDPTYGGSYAARLSYDFAAVKDNFVVFQARPAVAIGALPAALSVWVYGDDSGHFLNVWLADGAGQVRQYTFGQIKHQGWQQMTAPLDDAAGWPNVHISGPNSGKLGASISLHSLVLDGVPDGAASKGIIYLDNLATGAQSGQAPGGTRITAATPAPAPAAALRGRISASVFADDRRTYDLYVGGIDGANFQRVFAQGSQSSLRPDGQQIAFRGWNANDRGVIIMDTYGGNQRRLTNYVEDGLPSYSPNGQSLVFASARESDRRSRIYQINIGGGAEWQLKYGADPVFGTYPTWLGNGQIAYKSEFPQQGIMVMNADGAAPRLLANDASATAPAGSPDSRWIAFMSQRDGNWEIYRVNLDGAGQVRLTSNGANDGLPAWSPDGSAIAFLSDREGGWAVWVMNADGSNQRRLFSLPASAQGAMSEPSHNSQGWITERLSWAQ